METKISPRLEISSVRIRELRRFGGITGLLLIVIGGILVPTLKEGTLILPLIILGVVFLGTALAMPRLLDRVHRGLLFIMSWTTKIFTSVVLAVLYVFIFVPIGIYWRWRSIDPMQRKFQPDKKTYRILRPPLDPKHMERPF